MSEKKKQKKVVQSAVKRSGFSASEQAAIKEIVVKELSRVMRFAYDKLMNDIEETLKPLIKKLVKGAGEGDSNDRGPFDVAAEELFVNTNSFGPTTTSTEQFRKGIIESNSNSSTIEVKITNSVSGLEYSVSHSGDIDDSVLKDIVLKWVKSL